MLQKEVVDRMAAAPGNKDYGRLTVMLQWRYGIESLLDVPPEAFDPPPRVDSAVRADDAAADPRRRRCGAACASSSPSASRSGASSCATPSAAGSTRAAPTSRFDLQRRAEEVPVDE